MKAELEEVRLLLAQGRTRQARRALDELRAAGKVTKSEQWRIHELYGAIFHDLADAEGAAAAYSNAAQADQYLRSQREHYSNYLFALHYLPGITADELRQQMMSYRGLYRGEEPLAPRGPVSHERLRIGFLASDFLDSSSARFYEPLLTGLDASAYTVYLYALSDREDEFTRLLQSAGLTWRSLQGMSIRQGAETIRWDEIDILVDLAGHADGGMTLMLMGLQPAPVQICGIGWFDTTGLPAVDAFLTDAVMDPEAEEGGFCEQLLRLPTGFCFEPTAAMREQQRLRAKRETLTFGSFLNFMKINQPVMECWRQILLSMPDSRLIVQDTTRLPERCQEMQVRFERAGLPMERIEVRPGNDHYLADYQQIDIMLDSFPYPGGAAAATALYMGVPVVALNGDHHSARLSASLLTAAGHPEWVASSMEAYVQTALQLASDRSSLQRIQQHLRQELEQSLLMDRQQYCASFQQTCRRLWQDEGDYTL